MAAPRVFVVQQPTGRSESGEVEFTMDLTPALEYGEIIFVLGPTANPLRDLEGCATDAARCLVDHGFCDDDYLLLVGNPVLIGLVSGLAMQKTLSLRCLMWQRSARRYELAEADVEDQLELVVA